MKFGFLVAGVFLLASCSSSSSTTSMGNIGAAVGGLFSQSGQSATARNVENDTCGEFTGQEGAGAGGPEGVSTTASVTAGTYGSTSDSVTVTADEDCETSPNSSTSYAAFTLTADVVGTCTGGTNVTMASGSGGIFRNTATHQPEIYGTFTFTAGGETFTGIKCTMRLLPGGTVDTANSSCVDSSGAAVSLSSSNTCTFN